MVLILKIDALNSAKVFEFVVHISILIVHPYYHDDFPGFAFNMSLEFLKIMNYFTLMMKEVDPSESRKVINKCKYIAALAD